MKKRIITSILILLVISAVFVIGFPFVFYLKILPYLVENPKFSEVAQSYAQEQLGANLTLKNPYLKTEMKPEISFGAEEISLSKNNKYILRVNNIKSTVSFRQVFDKIIDLKEFGADNLFVDANGVMSLIPKQTGEQKPSEWTFNWLDSRLFIKKCYIIYKPKAISCIKIQGKDLEITASRKPKYVHFKLRITLERKGSKPLQIHLWDKDRVYIENHKMYLDKFLFFVNRSPVFVKAVSDDRGHYDLSVFSDKFDLKTVVNFLKTNIVIPNGSDMLMFFKDIDGLFSFNFHLSNNDFSGKVDLKNGFLRIIPLANLPINVSGGEVVLTKSDIFLKNFKGYYGSDKKRNSVEMKGGILDYTKTVRAEVVVKGNLTNDFAKNYLTKLVGYPLAIQGDVKTRVKVKTNYNKIDIRAFSKLDKGEDVLVGGMSLTPKNWQRAFTGEFHFEDNILDIKKINYYIAQEISKKTRGKNPVVLQMRGKVDCEKLKILNMGVYVPIKLPSEFMNIFCGKGFFKKGTFTGKIEYINTAKIPYLNGNMDLEGVRIPSQRLRIKEGKLRTDNKVIHIAAKGRFRRSGYTFDGDIKNEMIFPVVVKNVDLTVEKLDVEKVLKTFNSNVYRDENGKLVEIPVEEKPKTDVIQTFSENDEEESDENIYTFPPNLLVVEKCMLHLINGVYKDINFGNMHANLTLTKGGILEVQSNKFDFAEGISTCKIYCDLMKHKYSVRLGAKDVDSDLIASTILGLKKEISGKSRALLEFYSDDSMKLNGSIKFDIKDGTIAKLGLVEYLLKVAALFRNPIVMISPSTFVDLVNVPEGTFKVISGSIRIRDNVVDRIFIKSSSPQLSSFVVGRFNLITRDASLRIYTKFSSKGKGMPGFLRNFSLNTLARKISPSAKNAANLYAAEIEMLPKLETGEENAQVFLTTVEGDVEHNNFLSSLKKIK